MQAIPIAQSTVDTPERQAFYDRIKPTEPDAAVAFAC